METQQSIYKASRSIKKRDNTLYNALLSIYHDSIFVGEISQLWPQLPLLANLRCGLWYSSRFQGTCYFKSTDGHTNNWSFNTSRLNLHVALLAGNKGGCLIVDSTRKGKRFPDSMSKTIPIWTCVLNRTIQRYRKKMHENGSVEHMNENISHANDDERAKEALNDWDCSLHLPLWVSKTEKASIENRLDEFTALLEESGADIASLAASLRKPLRPLWISQKSVIWLNEVPDHDSWDFTPVILVSGSSSNGYLPQRTSSEFSWNYIPGAGDDEESWARGLTPILFWNHVYDLINCGPDLCNQKVSEIVEKDRVYRAQRGQDAPQILVKSQKAYEKIGKHELPLHSEFENLDIGGSPSTTGDTAICWLGSTKIAVGTTQLAATKPDIDCILNCGKELLTVDQSYSYLHLPVVSSKFDRFSLLNNLPAAVKFARSNLVQGKSLLVCCHDGEDISVCVCLAILILLFSEEGSFDDGKSFYEAQITKWEMRKRLVFICKFSTNARPSRGNLRQVFGFLNNGTSLNS
ncbi:tRNA A64-2'-O-ribosylphosphate transferase isoform X1 [Beta vulgaris subsp. vulgaris]|uniref:tRNA A64-2'-O-ribosylphosphate transferase isoform X1 n=1 Tax=Beta vulgaris subsp. vulgaris TaxID=3555 RepID=UPI002036DDA0|nr:tRNA A64-2'-O-ribosylphosphate transferase isoform X1 [Beta vulgaris subsp. vulgaris]